MIKCRGANCWGVDYSEAAVDKAADKYPELTVWQADYHSADWVAAYHRIVMQGVLEHLDDPFTELKWIMDNLLGEHGDVITSSPCFLNPRGIVWMTLDMLGAVMSKTDLHFLHPWQFDEFCTEHGYTMTREDCDWDWGNGYAMIEDFKRRIILAMKDGDLVAKKPISSFLYWLEKYLDYRVNDDAWGATMVYRITK